MGSVNLVVIVEAIRDLVAKQSAGFNLSSIILVAVALGMLFLMLSKELSNKSNSRQICPFCVLLLCPEKV